MSGARRENALPVGFAIRDYIIIARNSELVLRQVGRFPTCLEKIESISDRERSSQLATERTSVVACMQCVKACQTVLRICTKWCRN